MRKEQSRPRRSACMRCQDSAISRGVPMLESSSTASARTRAARHTARAGGAEAGNADWSMHRAAWVQRPLYRGGQALDGDPLPLNSSMLKFRKTIDRNEALLAEIVGTVRRVQVMGCLGNGECRGDPVSRHVTSRSTSGSVESRNSTRARHYDSCVNQSTGFRLFRKLRYRNGFILVTADCQRDLLSG